MLSSILKKSDCAECRFCCSFRRQSLWETPIFDKESLEKLRKLFPKAKFRPVISGSASGAASVTDASASAAAAAADTSASDLSSSYTFDISDQYKTDDPEEEAACPFLDTNSGCVLPPELKPFDCSIWPFRAVRRPAENGEQKLAVALTPTCPAINKVPRSQITELLHQGGLAKKILDYAKEHPDIIKDYSEFLSDLF